MLWLIAYLMILYLMARWIPLLCRDYIKTSITATIESEVIPTEHIEYPGIAICNVNRISLRKATMLATNMYNANITDKTVDQILYAIKDLGYFYNTDFKINKNYSDLTPECSRLLKTCVLHGEERNCSEIFSVTKTEEGYCCTFNYFPFGDDNITLELVGKVGKTEGLEVTLDPMLDDYFYTIMPVMGFKLLLFRPRDYAAVIAGGIAESLIAPATKRYLKVRALSLSSSDSIRSYPEKERKCIFADEKRLIQKSYTSNYCIIACVIKDLWKYCKCRLFITPDFGFEHQYNRTCILADVPCLYNYIATRYDFVPFYAAELEYLIKKNSTVYCEACYPTCNDVTYQVATTSVESSGIGLLFDVNTTAAEKYSILCIYFTDIGTFSMRQDVTYMWYEYLSDIGGICGLFLGSSLISVVELVYFIILCLIELLTSDSPKANEKVVNQHAQPPMQFIYWDELFPRSRTTKPVKKIRKGSKKF